MIGKSLKQRWWALSYLKPEWRALSLGSALMIARAGVLLATPWPLKFIVDNVIFQRRLSHSMAALLPDPITHRMLLLDELAMVTLALGAANAIFGYFGNRLFLDTGQRVVFHIRFDLFSHLQRLSLAFHRSNRAGEIMTRLTGDVKELQDFVAAIGIDVLPNALTIVGMAVVMMIVDVRFALMAMVVAPLLIWLARSYATRLRQALRQVRRHEGALTGVAQEILSAVQVVQAFGREVDEDKRFSEHAGESLKANLRANAIQSQFGPIMNVSIAAATGLLSWYGAASVINGSISPGELLIFLAYFRGMAAPARQVAKTGRAIGRAVVAFERIGEYRALRSDVADSPCAMAPDDRACGLQFDKVEFAYRAGHAVLSDISFVLRPGRTVALVGATGSGKSTIAGLVPRFYDPTAGKVMLDGKDLRELPLQYVRRQIALVLQEPVLFQASVWENIAYGLEGAGREEAIEAAEAVGVADIIERLPDGFETLISERGQTLSGGQRQCVSIARAMLRDAPIVILDEPSSSLDSRSEKQIMAAIERLTNQRAALVIAHRLSTVMKADEILVMERGRIVQRGSHSDLLSDGGTYSMLWQALNEDIPPTPLRLVAQ